MRTHKAKARNRVREVLLLHTARAGICTGMVQRMRPHRVPRMDTALPQSTGAGAQDRHTRNAMAVKRVGSTGGRGHTEAMRLVDTTGEAMKATCCTRNRARPHPIMKVPLTTMRKAARHTRDRRMFRRGTCTEAEAPWRWEAVRPPCTIILHTAVVRRPITRGRQALVLLRTNTKARDIHMTTHRRTGMHRMEGAGPLAAIWLSAWAHTLMARRERMVQEAVLLLTWARAASGYTRCWRPNSAMPAGGSMTSTLTPSIV